MFNNIFLRGLNFFPSYYYYILKAILYRFPILRAWAYPLIIIIYAGIYRNLSSAVHYNSEEGSLRQSKKNIMFN